MRKRRNSGLDCGYDQCFALEIKSVKSELEKINQKLDTKLENREERIAEIEHRVGVA